MAKRSPPHLCHVRSTPSRYVSLWKYTIRKILNIFSNPIPNSIYGISLLSGPVSAGMAIFDTMQYIKCDVSTICMGMAASMGAFLLAAGTKGKRYALPNSEIMIHQPLGSAEGQATDILIHAKHIEKIREKINQILADETGRPIEEIRRDTERDNFMSADEAAAYGLVDKVIKTR